MMVLMNDHRFSHLTPAPTRHFREQLVKKSLDARAVIMTWREPEEVYPSGSHPGQWRITGNGVCIVGRPEDDGTFAFITIYEDRVLTPPRPDQTDAAGMRYRERWERGQGRG